MIICPSSKIKGIQIEIGGNTDKLGNALSSVEKQTKNLQTELKGVNTLLKADPSNVVLLTQKQELLTQAIDETSEKLKILKESQKQVQEQFERGEITQEQYRDFQREIIATEQKLNNLKDELKEFSSVAGKQMELAGKSVQEFGTKIKDTGQEIKDLSGKFAPLSATATAGLGAAITTATSLEDATTKFISSTGKAINETDKYRNILQSIHDNNYGEDYADIADKMRIVSNILGDLPDEQLQSVVEKTYMLEDAYGMDFQETLRGIRNLMYQYGLTSDEAFDLFVKNLSGEEYYVTNNPENEEAIYLNTDSSVTVATDGGVENTGIENSIRVAFTQLGRVKADTTDQDTITGMTCADDEDGAAQVTGICRSAQIWEPNDTDHVQNAINWYDKSCLARTAADVDSDASYTDGDISLPV